MSTIAQPVKRGTKWTIRWIDALGHRRRASFKDRNTAVAELAKRRVEIAEMREGKRPAPPPEKMFGDLADYWLANRAVRKRSKKDDESIIEQLLRPAFGRLRLRVLGAQHVDAFVVEQLQRVRPNGPATRTITPKTVNNYLTVLTAMLNCAVEIGWLAKAPKIKKLRVRILGKDFRYLRTDDEIRRFLIAAKEEGESVFALYATAVYTGMRAGELAGLHWDDVSFDRRLITVQRSFTGPTKAEDVRYVPILDALLPVLRAWRLRCAGHLVFQNQRGGMLGPSGRIFQEMLHRVLERAGLPRRYITFHGARHTFASHWMMNSGDLFKLQKILGHKSVQMTLRYAHLAPDAYAGDYHRLGAGHVGSSEIARIAPNARSAGAVH